MIIFFFHLGLENIVRLLIESHAEVDVSDNYFRTPLHFAAQNGNENQFRAKTDNS